MGTSAAQPKRSAGVSAAGPCAAGLTAAPSFHTDSGIAAATGMGIFSALPPLVFTRHENQTPRSGNLEHPSGSPHPGPYSGYSLTHRSGQVGGSITRVSPPYTTRNGTCTRGSRGVATVCTTAATATGRMSPVKDDWPWGGQYAPCDTNRTRALVRNERIRFSNGFMVRLPRSLPLPRASLARARACPSRGEVSREAGPSLLGRFRFSLAEEPQAGAIDCTNAPGRGPRGVGTTQQDYGTKNSRQGSVTLPGSKKRGGRQLCAIVSPPGQHEGITRATTPVALSITLRAQSRHFATQQNGAG
jgi:hypothetical protein